MTCNDVFFMGITASTLILAYQLLKEFLSGVEQREKRMMATYRKRKNSPSDLDVAMSDIMKYKGRRAAANGVRWTFSADCKNEYHAKKRAGNTEYFQMKIRELNHVNNDK